MVSGQVVELVVVALEKIEIDHADRQRLLRRIGFLFRLFHRNEQGPAVVDAGQVVAARLFLDALELDAHFAQACCSRWMRPPMKTNQGKVAPVTTNCSTSNAAFRDRGRSRTAAG